MNQRSVFSWWRPFSLQPIHTQSSAQGAETRPAPGDAGYARGDPSRRGTLELGEKMHLTSQRKNGQQILVQPKNIEFDQQE